MQNAVHLHRVLKAPPARVYRAFIDPRAMTKWMPPHGFVGEVHESNPVAGGTYRMSFINLGTGQAHSFGGTYVELIPDQCIRYIDRFDDPALPEAMDVTIRLQPVACGTQLTISQQNIPPAIPVEFCYLGWQESLNLLALLVEPEIPSAPSP